ncbi:MAG TPA: 4-phosphoerythronate dehydrogenase [Kiritimatiellia bacterium]|nr:4-phosphoerythronate dehydrogenase [Kiritimatiellia bacterium]
MSNHVGRGPRALVCSTSLAEATPSFAPLGDVTLLPETDISTHHLLNAHALFTRSKVRVDAALLSRTSVQFYGTATAGADHVDASWLEKQGIAWTSAPGCNANSVAEYIIAALLHHADAHQLTLSGNTIGIIGAGHVGSRVAHLAQTLGLIPLLNDPPLFDQTRNPIYQPLDHLLANADILTLHVPLVTDGPYPTLDLINHETLSKLKPGALFLNASRGEVVDETALAQARASGILSGLVLDVFKHEPAPAHALLNLTDLATPHIAGYSYDGRLNGTLMLADAYRTFLGLPPAPPPPPPPLNQSELPPYPPRATLESALHLGR